MDLRSAYPYWLLRNGIPYVYPSLRKNLRKEVVIIGAGISGSLAAWYLHKAGFDVAVIDRRHVGMGSTAASTALLQYEIDTPLHKLKDIVGEQDAVASYELCRKAIYDLQQITKKFKTNSEFRLTPSFQYASFKKHAPALKKEFELRQQHGFDIKWLEEKDIRKLYGFEAPAGILSADGGEINAYGVTNEILQYLHKKGVAIYDHTNVSGIQHHKSSIELKTDNDVRITCKKLIIACGYESQNYIPFEVCKLNSTYAIVSEPVAMDIPWHRESMIWETAQPYIYLRVTRDNRILIGGKDDPWYNPKKRDARLPAKADALQKKFAELFPKIPFYTDFKWAGTFASTKDGLPYIGTIRQRPNVYFALGFGGNGITFSVVAAQIIADQLSGKKNKYADIFRFGR
jgi:glycine/D-amino acid oxidase-like deaminating enzyme